MINILKETNITIDLQETGIKELKTILEWFIENGYVVIRETGNVSMTTGGVFLKMQIIANEKYRGLFSMKECIFCEK